MLVLGCGPRAVVDSDPEPAPREALYRAGVLLRQGDVTDARAAYQALLDAHPGSWGAARGVQDAERRLLAPDVFERRYRELRAESPDDPLAAYLYGRSRVERRDEAAAAFEAAAAGAPDNPWPLAGIAWLHAAEGDLFLAVETYEAGLQRHPRSATLRYLLGNQLLTLRLVVEAERHLSFARRLAPGDPQILAALGKTWVELGRSDQGAALLEEALAADPTLADVALSLAGVALAARDPERAEALYRRALEGGMPPDEDLWGAIRAAKLVESQRSTGT